MIPSKSEPVLVNGAAAALASAAVPVLIDFGVHANQAGQVGSYAGAGLALVLAVWHLYSARSKVTPVAGTTGLVAALERVAGPLEKIAGPAVDAAVASVEAQAAAPAPAAPVAEPSA